MSAHFKTLHATLTALVLSVPLTAAAVLPALADTITRGCSGGIFLTGAGIPDRLLVDLDARGSCEGRRNANRCRIRAYDVLRSCLTAVVDEWADHDIPQECRSTGGGPRSGMNIFEYQGVFPNFPNGNTSINDRIRYESCCAGGGRLGRHDVAVIWNTTGDLGCTGRTQSGNFGNLLIAQGELWETIETRCTAAWDNGFCQGTRPTQGTRTNPTE